MPSIPYAVEIELLRCGSARIRLPYCAERIWMPFVEVSTTRSTNINLLDLCVFTSTFTEKTIMNSGTRYTYNLFLTQSAARSPTIDNDTYRYAGGCVIASLIGRTFSFPPAIF